MPTLNFSGSQREPFAQIEKIIVEALPRWGYQICPETSGWAEGDLSREHTTYQFTDRKGKEVLFYDFQRQNGAYAGILRVNLPPAQSDQVLRRAEQLIPQKST